MVEVGRDDLVPEITPEIRVGDVEMDGDYGHVIINPHPDGISLLDFFAGSAIPVVWAGFAMPPNLGNGDTPHAREIARKAYNLAEAMIREKEARGNGERV